MHRIPSAAVVGSDAPVAVMREICAPRSSHVGWLITTALAPTPVTIGTVAWLMIAAAAPLNVAVLVVPVAPGKRPPIMVNWLPVMKAEVSSRRS
jgi:hypothetical protein